MLKRKKCINKRAAESYKNSKTCYIYQKEIESKYEKDKKYCKLDIIVIIQGNVELLCIIYVT